MKRQAWLTYGGTISASLALHLLFLQDMQAAADHAPPKHLHRVEMQVVQTRPSPPPPPPAPEPPKPRPKPTPHTPPKPQPLSRVPQPMPKPKEDLPPPPPNAPPPPPDAPAAPPMFGISLTSTVGSSASGFAVPTGNTTMTTPGAKAAGKPGPLAPVPSHAVSHLPKRIGDCKAPYPSEAMQLHLEGHITFEVDVAADGHVTGVHLIAGALGHKLDEAAMAALRRCRFTPADVNGSPVATSIEYIYTWQIDD